MTDHPRSRGVYKCAGREMPEMAGIIPARAGFTGVSCAGERDGRDHPRSRGVYRGRVRGLTRTEGSSPLARGLRDRGLPQAQAGGIIPARAGFTCTPLLIHGKQTDHPRSRGVYLCRGCRRWCPVGSSPLARGLRPPPVSGRARPGIIPARAGFTAEGVGEGAGDGGSSPLARGLPRPGCIRAPSRRDHPRSRGVYPPRRRIDGRTSGSSPLARGLPGRVRAWAWGSPDHPRSRGVYPSATPTRFPPRGSSPLARGLLFDGVPCGGCVGIIPARAGFTRGGAGAGAWCPDHPRSRGVYWLRLLLLLGRLGSSPLARGLPVNGLAGRVRNWIIPARAGFTLPH